MIIIPPATQDELLERAQALAGRTIGDLGNQAHESIPKTLHQAKGWVGQLIEKLLGATAGSLDQPDFMHLGIELKTLPISPFGLPRESTYICTAPIPPQDKSWLSSRVYRKMAKILWIPIESSNEKPLLQQRVGAPILWEPSPQIHKQLQLDWEELTELMLLGRFNELNARHGQFLQIRPKAANAKTFIQVLDNEGQMISLVPKGFYLRTILTKLILQENYISQSSSK